MMSSSSSQLVMYYYNCASIRGTSEEILLVVKKDHEASTEQLYLRYSSYLGEWAMPDRRMYKLGYWDEWMDFLNKLYGHTIVEKII